MRYGSPANVEVVLRLLSSLLCLASCADRTGSEFAEPALLQGFEELHRKVYEVYALPFERDAIHDLLDACFFGPALTHEYVEHFTTRVRMRREETAIHIVNVDYDDVRLLDVEHERYRVGAAWSVGGVVTHQGHKHTRVNRYEAVYTLAQTPKGLRIVDTRLRNLRRVRSALGTGFADFASGQGQDDRSSAGFMSPLELLRRGVADDAASAGGSGDEAGEKSTDFPR